MLKLKTLILFVVVVSNLALTLPASFASANESASSVSLNAEFSTSVGGVSETTTSENANIGGHHNSNNGGGDRSQVHSSSNSAIASSASVPTVSTTSSPSSAPQNVKSKIAETGPSSTKTPTGGLLAGIGSAIEAAKSAFSTESSSSANKSASATKPLHSDASDELPLNKSAIAGKEHDANEPLHKFCIYMKPICDSIDHISPKQMARLQSQFKQFVQLTGGKLSSCFLEQYFFDPAAKPVTKTDLSVICSSKSAFSKTADNYRNFQSCAVKNWNPQVDKELDKIAAARLNCTKMHHHASGDSDAAIGLSQDDDDDFNMLNDVVNKSLHAEKSSNITFSETKTHQQQQQHSDSNSSEGLMSKIHSVLTGSSSNSTSSHPTTSKPNGQEQMSTKEPLFVIKSSSQAPTKQSGSLMDKLLGGGSTSSPNSLLTTKPPTISSVDSSVAPSFSISSSGKNEIKSSKAPIVEATTIKVTTPAPTKLITKSTTSAAVLASLSSSIKPLETLEQVLKRQEREKQQLEDKLKAERERVLKQLQKKQDEMDAQNAIRALQMQRQSSSASDQRLHQLEHQRQMAIDPFGHTIKHQQYELRKQQKASGKQNEQF